MKKLFLYTIILRHKEKPGNVTAHSDFIVAGDAEEAMDLAEYEVRNLPMGYEGWEIMRKQAAIIQPERVMQLIQLMEGGEE